MRVAVISDLHLGDGGRCDPFEHDDGEFERRLERLEREFERIVLLGDVYECLAGRTPFAARRELARARAAHPTLERRFASAPYVYIHGNHDWITGPLEGAPEAWMLRLDGRRVLFTHGHHHDRLIQRARWFSETGVWFGGWMARAGLEPVRRWLSEVEDSLRVREDPASCPFQAWALGVARRRSADVIVTAHTHRGAVHDHGDVVYANSGACAHGEFSFVALDTASGSVELHTSI